MPVTVAGMHRSGTSMIVRLLNLCGLYLGPPGDLLGARPSNSEGHWEHIKFIDINDRLLGTVSARWNLPPPAGTDWSAAAFDSLREEGQRLLDSFRPYEPWGWKDPRTCLTLPFWKALVPGLSVVVPIRHPYEVADSLSRRDLSARESSLQLWIEYHQALLAATSPNERIVTAYDAFLSDPEFQLRRILERVAIPTPAEVLSGACGAVKPRLRHHRAPAADGKNELSRTAVDLYETFVREAQASPAEVSSDQEVAPTPPPSPDRFRWPRRTAWLVLARFRRPYSLEARQAQRLAEAELQLASRIRWERDSLAPSGTAAGRQAE